MSRRRLSSILKELDEVAHQADSLVKDFTGEGIFDRAKRGWRGLQEQSPTTEDPYEVLGLDPNCIPSDIIYRYRQLAKKYHPDGDEPDVERFKKVTAAYEELCRQRGIK